MFVIAITSKHEGDFKWLGYQFKTRDEAKVYAEREICSRCNRYEIYERPDDYSWKNREEGFVSKERMRY